jgi:hypothetical protein
MLNNKNEANINWCKGKSWIVRLPVLVFMIYLLYQNISNPDYFGLIKYVDLIIHEAGHWVFMPFGEVFTILGGTLLQLIVPIVFIFSFWKQSDYFGASFCLAWLGDNLFYVAAYIGDARARILPLLGGDSSGHDWYALLSRWNMLNYDTIIATAVNLLGVAIMVTGVVWGGWVLWMMHVNKIKK